MVVAWIGSHLDTGLALASQETDSLHVSQTLPDLLLLYLPHMLLECHLFHEAIPSCSDESSDESSVAAYLMIAVCVDTFISNLSC